MKRLVVIALAAIAWPAAASEVVTLDASAQSRAGIQVRPVETRTFGNRIRVIGQVVRSPGTTVTVKAVLAGRVEAVHVAPGDRVRAGDLLAELHSHDLLAMQGELLRADGQARLAENRLQAGRQLFALDGISRQELELREQTALSAALESAAAREEMIDLGVADDTVERLLSERQTDPHLPVRAPLDGVVLELPVQQHEWIQAYEPLLVIGDPKRVELELQLPPDQAASVGPGDPVEFAPVGHPGMTGLAEVVTRVPEVDPTTRTVKVRGLITQGAPDLFPGVFVDGTLTHGAARETASVPESAVIRYRSSDVVFVRTSPTTFELRAVSLGVFDGTRYEVLEGLEPDAEVVVQGVFYLKSALVKGEGEEG